MEWVVHFRSWWLGWEEGEVWGGSRVRPDESLGLSTWLGQWVVSLIVVITLIPIIVVIIVVTVGWGDQRHEFDGETVVEKDKIFPYSGADTIRRPVITLHCPWTHIWLTQFRPLTMRFKTPIPIFPSSTLVQETHSFYSLMSRRVTDLDLGLGFRIREAPLLPWVLLSYSCPYTWIK
jgi:hypothetical protein